MNSSNFLDANVWLALMATRHTRGAKAREGWDSCADEKFYFCRLTQLSALRLLTTPAVMGPDVKKMSEAWALLDQICIDDRVAFLQEPPGIETEFRRLTSLASASPKVWADSYLLAFAAAAGLKLVTFDQSLRDKARDVLVL